MREGGDRGFEVESEEEMEEDRMRTCRIQGLTMAGRED